MRKFRTQCAETFNDNETLFHPHLDILFSQNLFETLKVEIFTEIECAFYVYKITFVKFILIQTLNVFDPIQF